MNGSDAFADWTEPFPDRPILRRLDPPTPVVVDLAGALAGPDGFARIDGVPLRVRAGGITLGSDMAGTLHGWVRRADGRWLAHVCVRVSSANQRNCMDLWLWVDAAHLTQRPSAGREESKPLHDRRS